MLIENNIKNFSENISKNYAEIKEKVNNDIVSSFDKIPDLKINSNIIEKKKNSQFLDVSWKTYRIVSLGIILMSIFLGNFVRMEFERRTTDEYIIMMVNIIIVFFIFNLSIFLFYKSYYKYISTLKGKTGVKGKRGNKGITGKNSICDISNKKVGTFNKQKHIIKKEKIVEKEDEEDNTTLDITKTSRKGWYETGSFNKQLGFKCDSSKNNCDNKDNKNNKDNKPIIGAAINYDSVLNKILAIQYLYDDNKSHNKKKYKIGNFGKTTKDPNNGTIGEYRKISKTIKKHNFVCPPNSAIYKIESVYDQDGIKGLKFHCQDITTGNAVKAYNPKNKKVYGVSFGEPCKPDNPNYMYDKMECKTDIKENKIYPSFISEIGGEYSNISNNIQNLKFNNCSIYIDK